MIDYQGISMSYPPINGSSHLSGIGIQSNKAASSLLSIQARHGRQLQNEVDRYEKQLDSTLSSISANQKQLRESMLAYTDRAMTLNRRRYYIHPDSNTEDIGLRKYRQGSNKLSVQARRIPKRRLLHKLTADIDDKKKHKALEVYDNSKSEGKYIAEEAMSRSYTVPPLGHHKRRPSVSNAYKAHFAAASDLTDILHHKAVNKGIMVSQGIDSKPSLAWECQVQPDQDTVDPRVEPVDQRRTDNVNHNNSVNPRMIGAPYGSQSTKNARYLNVDPKISTLVDNILTEEKKIELASTTAVIDTSDHDSARRESDTKKLLADAIKKLQSIEKRISNPLLSLPKIKRRKKKLKKLELINTLDAIPEDEEQKGVSIDASLQGDMSHPRSAVSPTNPQTNHTQNKSIVILAKQDLTLDQPSRATSSHILPPVHQSRPMVLDENSFKSRKLQLRTKLRQRPKKLRFLKAY